MDRRSFIRMSSLLAWPLGLSGCDRDSDDADQGTSTFPQLTFLTRDPGFTDYRPAVDVAGEQVVFERTPFPNPDDKLNTELYFVKSATSTSPSAAKFLPPPPSNPGASYPFSQTRPDWSWMTGLIAFNGAPSNRDVPLQVHLVASDAGGLRVVPDTRAHIYPIWTSDGAQLITFDSSDGALPAPPVTALINPDGSVIYPNLNGADAAGIQVFGGFAAPKPGLPTQIAFAGQPALPNWGIPPAPASPGAMPVYDQDHNYVFLNANKGGVFSSAPLEAGASVITFDGAHQGRAPYWSPDGNYLVFESSRAGGYALFLANVAKGTAPRQLTNTQYWAQHAKFFPSGRKLVFTALQQPSAAGEGPRGIAVIDIASYL